MKRPVKRKRAWQDSNLRHTAPETVALSPELQARAKETASGCYRNASTPSNGALQSLAHRINYAAPEAMYAVVSDIPGNLEALEVVLRDLPDEFLIVYCLGDVIGYGANPDECCDIVRDLGMPVISGNHDLAVTDLETDLNWFNPVAAAAVVWTREHLSRENV